MNGFHLFVNCNNVPEETVDGTAGSVTSAIKSHVRTRKVRELKASRRARTQFNIVTPSGYQQELVAKNRPQRASANGTVLDSSPRASPPKPQHRFSHLRDPSLVHSKLGGNHDPFNAAALELDALATHLITLVTTHHASMIWPFEFSVERRTSPTQRDWRSMVRDIVMDQAQLASFLAFGAALKLQIHGRPYLPQEDTHALDRIIACHQPLAVQGIVRHLESNTTGFVMLSTVLHLLCLEMYLPNLAVARTHLRALQSIVLAMGGVSKLPYILCEYFISIAVRAAYVLNEELPVEFGDWDSGPLHAALDTRADPLLATEIPHLLAHSQEVWRDLYSLCDNYVAGLMNELREIFVMEELRDTKLQDSEKYQDIYRWIRPRVVSTRYRMCRLRMVHLGLLTQAFDALGLERPSPLGERIYVTLPPADSFGSHPPPLLLRNAFVCLGATFCAAISLYRAREKIDYWGVYVEWEKWLLYCLDGFFTLRQSASPSGISRKETELLVAATAEKHADVEIALWATVSGVIAHPMQRTSSLARLKYLDGIVRHFMSILGLRSHLEVRDTCKRYLWHESVMDPALRNFMCGGL